MDDLEIPGQNPEAKLANLLREESLEERFQRILVSTFRRICDGGYFPGRELLEAVEKRGAVPFTRDWLLDDRAQPVLDVLCQSRRLDLAVERLVERVPYSLLFDQTEHESAKAHLAAVKGWRVRLQRDKLLEEPVGKHEWAEAAITNLNTDSDYSRPDLYALQRRRASEWSNKTVAEQLTALEEELQDGYRHATGCGWRDVTPRAQRIDGITAGALY